MVTYCDPPKGWLFGFPKPLPEDLYKEDDGILTVLNTHKWLVSEGYPEHLIKEYGDHFYCRYWTE